MGRTTLDIDQLVLDELKELQVKENKSLGQLASELLGDALARRRKPAPRKKLKWISRDLKPLVNLEDKEALNAILGPPSGDSGFEAR